jgi:hypothetical protein
MSAQLIISEFRVRGPSGASDEFIEIYNNSGADHTVAAISGTGYGIAASDGVVRCTIPNGTVIPARGHYLCTNSVAYSLNGYATGDATFTTDIPDNAGIALFNNDTGGGSFSLANRFDAVGSTAEANVLYKEGTGYPALTPFSIDYSFYRDNCGKGGSITTLGPCPTGGAVIDTNNNAADFVFVDTNGTSAGAGQRLGAPGPENLASPITGPPGSIVPLDATVGDFSPPNFVRDFTSDPPNNSTFGTISLRRRYVNNSGVNLTRLRFRIIDQTTFPAPSGFADLRSRTSVAVVVAGINDPATCAATGTPPTPPCTVTVEGTTLEQPPSSPNGNAFNSSMSAGTVTLGTPLASGASLDLQFLFGLQQTGTFKVGLLVEALPPGGGGELFEISGCTDGCPVVSSSVRADPDPTSAQTLHYTVTFSESVTGVDATDFALTPTGTVAGATVTNVSGSGAVYTVTVDRGTGTGTLRLDVVDDDSIVNGSAVPLGGVGAGNGNFTAGEFYTIVAAAPPPTVSSSVRADPDPTFAQTLHYTVTFSEAVTGVDATDFALTTTGAVAGATVTNVSGSGAVYTVTVDRGTGTGTIRLDVIDNDSIVNAALVPLGGVGAGNGNFTTGQVYTIIAAPPPPQSVPVPMLDARGLAALGALLLTIGILVLRRS